MSLFITVKGKGQEIYELTYPSNPEVTSKDFGDVLVIEIGELEPLLVIKPFHGLTMKMICRCYS